MAVLPIEQGKDNKVLRTKSAEVKKIDKKLFKLLDDMRATLKQAGNGIGIAAPQVGVDIRVSVCIFHNGTENERYVDLINPVIISKSEENITDEEGCLSLPGQFGLVPRSASVTVKFLDRKGKEQMLKLNEMDARLVQHEIDHLDGVLFVDRMVSDVVQHKRAL